MSKIQSYTSSNKCDVNLCGKTFLKRKDTISKNQPLNSAMSSTTKDFIQKICYRKTASIDMTQYGFINDCKLEPINLLMKPLKSQLEKICVKPERNESTRSLKSVRKKVKSNRQKDAPTPQNSRQRTCSSCSKHVPAPNTPFSAQSSPGSHSSHKHVRRVTYESQPKVRKKVTLVLPGTKDQNK